MLKQSEAARGAGPSRDALSRRRSRRQRKPAALRTQVKAKGQRKIGISEFKAALELIAEKKGCSVDDIVAKLKAGNGPVTNATQAEPNKFHDDKSLYTGVYKCAPALRGTALQLYRATATCLALAALAPRCCSAQPGAVHTG
jgi:p25-alpha